MKHASDPWSGDPPEAAGPTKARALRAAAPLEARSFDLIYRNVLDNVASGVMSFDSDGVIRSFNILASKIVGLPSEAVVGRTFAETFVPLEGGDEFVEVILDAIYDSSVGFQRVVEVSFGGRPRSLSMATSYLREERGGETVRLGVVAVFHDISDIRELRERELRLAKEVEDKHRQLQDAYRTLEDRLQELNAAHRKVRAARVVVAGFVLALVAAVGAYVWNDKPEVGNVAARPVNDTHHGGDGPPTMVVEPQRITSTIFVTGRLAPWREIDVTSPIKGKVAAVHVHRGEPVTAGQRLVDMDIAEVQIRYREAQAEHIKAQDRVRDLEDWENHVEVSRARRTVRRGRFELETRKNRLAETAFLLERGIIAAAEHEAAKREHDNRQLDLEAAEEDLRGVRAKGVAEIRVARLDLENARSRLSNLEEIIRKAAVIAPVSGVVMHPSPDSGTAGSGEQGRALAVGASVQQGEHLLTIGDLDGLRVVGRVDEVDVVRIRPGHVARIVGDAFPGLVLHGEIARVSSQASHSGDGNRLPSFQVDAVVKDLTEAQRRVLRLGMSAKLEVVVYEKKDALLVPIAAVDVHDRKPWLRVRDRATGVVRTVEVVTGATTVDAVEILDGIGPGDEIVLPKT